MYNSIPNNLIQYFGNNTFNALKFIRNLSKNINNSKNVLNAIDTSDKIEGYSIGIYSLTGLVNNPKELINANALAFLVGSSVQTISAWYRWKSLNPEHELAQLLPDYVRIGNKNTRYWNRQDVWMLIKFKQSIPQGRNGIMGQVTQKYCKNSKHNKKE